MKVLVRVYFWENPKLYFSDSGIAKGDKVIVPSEFCNELGVVEDIKVETQDEPENKILRAATQRDKEVFDKYESQKEELIEKCREAVRESQLPMKIIDARISLDGKQVIFVFTADGRIDFRDLVKELGKLFKKNIRLQQIGSRDEVRKLGGYGICGRSLCCVNFPGSIPSITTDMARVQQIAHRGTERISGLCGRLMCCLAFEAEQYRALMAGMPELYSVVEIKAGKGTVVDVNAVTQEIKVKLASGEYLTVKKEDIK